MIGFAGLSHLGIIYSLATAAKGFSALGYDPNEPLGADLGAGRFPITEPGLAELAAEHRSRFCATPDPLRLAECPLIFISLDVATDGNHRSDLAPLRRLIQTVVEHAAPETTLVLLSQVPPGFTRALQNKFHDRLKARRIQLFYQVETLVFGDAVRRALHPERYIIGASEPEAPLPSVYAQWLRAFDCPILPMRYESAELAKISINLFLVSSVSAANTLAELCEHLGADWSEIAQALRLDRRIGPHAYLTPGLGIAGGNLERDLVTIQTLAIEHGADDRLVSACQTHSRYRQAWALRKLSKHLPSASQPSRLAIWGLSYKENTHSTKNSPALALMEAVPHLEKLAYDPQAQVGEWKAPHFKRLPDALSCCQGADALAIMTPWPEFKKAELPKIRELMRGRLILDPHRLLDAKQARHWGFAYFSLGSP